MQILDEFLEKLEKKYKNIDELDNKSLENLEKEIEKFYKQHFEKLDKDKIRNVFFHYSRSIKNPVKFSFFSKTVQIIQLIRPETYPIPIVENLENESFLITISHPIFELIITEKELLPIFPVSELYIVEDELLEELVEKIFLKDSIIKNGVFYEANVIFRVIDYIFNKILFFHPRKSADILFYKEVNDLKVNETEISSIYNYIFEALTDVFIDKRVQNIEVQKEFEDVVINTLKDLSEVNFLIKTAQLENILITMFEEEEEEIFEIEKNNPDGIYNLIYFFGLENINFYFLSKYFDYDNIIENINRIVKELKNNENLKEDLEIFITNILDLPYISKEYKNKKLLIEVIKNTGFSEEFEEEALLNGYFRIFDYEIFLKNFRESETYFFETLIQYELSKMFIGQQDKAKTSDNIEKILIENEEDIVNDYRRSALEFLIFYLKDGLKSISNEGNVITFVLRRLYEGTNITDIGKEIPESILIEATLEEIFNEAKKAFIDLISFYPFDEKFYKLADIKFEYKLPENV